MTLMIKKKKKSNDLILSFSVLFSSITIMPNPSKGYVSITRAVVQYPYALKPLARVALLARYGAY